MTTPRKIAALVSSLSLFGAYLFFQARSSAKPTAAADGSTTSQPATRPTTKPAFDPRALIYSSKSAPPVHPSALGNHALPGDGKMLMSTSKSLVLIDPNDPSKRLLAGSKSAVLVPPQATPQATPQPKPPLPAEQAPPAEPPRLLLAGSKSKVLLPVPAATKPATRPTTQPAGK